MHQAQSVITVRFTDHSRNVGSQHGHLLLVTLLASRI
jgi:hypothetical protein